ncbi:MAG: prepilin-type N-terminal cleavage/methylation domain-containing protein, partial [Oscillibacter sp.]|nr:prepilin-type N-terminal cleavage/methylation domain-containing protein [Oscillibacter sp.]
MKKWNKGGFTLAELLIVVAIIAILVAIGIPAFSTAMERSREAVDLANMRAAYAEFMAGTLGDDY